MATPEAILIGGANGAGKTTFARELLPSLYRGVEFLNVDEIQREAPHLAHPMAAGRELLHRLNAIEGSRDSFAIETTLSSMMYAKRMRSWKTWGYCLTLHYIELPSDDYAVRRVATRVAAGGHAVPESDVRRRFSRGLVFFEQLYKPLADEWYHWYSDDEGLRLVDYRET